MSASLLKEREATVEAVHPIAHLPESLVIECLQLAGKTYALHGRDPRQSAGFGQGESMLMSSPGQHLWFDAQTDQMRTACIADVRDAVRLGNALANSQFVGALAQPGGKRERFREVLLAGELIYGQAFTRRMVACRRRVDASKLHRVGSQRRSHPIQSLSRRDATDAPNPSARAVPAGAGGSLE